VPAREFRAVLADRVVATPAHDVGMCEICNGMSYEEMWERMHEHIGAGQWFLECVEASAHTRTWAYTVGLVENFGHPELVVCDFEVVSGGSLLNEIATQIQCGLRVVPGATIDLDGYAVEIGAVHPSYVAHGLCAMWSNYYAWRGAPPGPFEVLQVIPPLTEWCDHCDRHRRCLSIPGERGFGGPNRAARRASRVRRR
jgi:hypothetical protein